jgi:hypothetical protein
MSGKMGRRFNFSADDYVEEFGAGAKAKNATLVPVTIAAAALGCEPTTVRAHIRQGKLDEVAVNCGEITVKGVTLGSLNAALESRREETAALADRIKPILWSRGGEPIEYGELMGRVGLSSHNPGHRAMLGRALARLSRRSLKPPNNILISALVVLKATHRPPPAFFRLAEELKAKKKSIADELFWQDEIGRIRDWSGRPAEAAS